MGRTTVERRRPPGGSVGRGTAGGGAGERVGIGAGYLAGVVPIVLVGVLVARTLFGTERGGRTESGFAPRSPRSANVHT